MTIVKENILAEPVSLGSLVAKNRILAQPLEHNQATDDGRFSEPLIDFYTKMRDGKWGIIILETTATSPQQKCRQHALVLDDTQGNAESWTRFFKTVKNESETIWIIEISAGGNKNISGTRKAAFHGQQEFPNGPVYTTEEIDALLDEYVNATRLAFERGADGIDFKMCHGYFASLLLRPNNTRGDRYGGNYENRTRFLTEYTRRAKKAIGDRNFLFTTRLNAWDGGIVGGIGMQESRDAEDGAWIHDDSEGLKTYDLLWELGYSLVNVSASLPTPSGVVNPNGPGPHTFFLFQDLALKAVKHYKTKNVPMRVSSAAWSALGSIAPAVGNAYISRGLDFIGFGRWQLCEPGLPRIILEDAPKSTGSIADYIEENANVCIACGKCGTGLGGTGPVTCPIYP